MLVDCSCTQVFLLKGETDLKKINFKGIGKGLIIVATLVFFMGIKGYAEDNRSKMQQRCNTSERNYDEIRVQCDDDKYFRVYYSNKTHHVDEVSLFSETYRKVARLPCVPSESGKRYSSCNELITLWKKGKTAFIKFDEKIYKNCKTKVHVIYKDDKITSVTCYDSNGKKVDCTKK